MSVYYPRSFSLLPTLKMAVSWNFYEYKLVFYNSVGYVISHIITIRLQVFDRGAHFLTNNKSVQTRRVTVS